MQRHAWVENVDRDQRLAEAEIEFEARHANTPGEIRTRVNDLSKVGVERDSREDSLRERQGDAK